MAPRAHVSTHVPQAMQDSGLATMATVRARELTAGALTGASAPSADATATVAGPETLPSARVAGPRLAPRPLPSRRRGHWPVP